MIPPILIKSLAGSLLILIIAQHHIGATGHYLTCNLLRIRGEDLHLHVVHCCTAGARHEVMVVAIGNEWRTLRSAITNGDGEINVLHEFLNLLIQWGTSYDDLVSLTAEGVIYLLTDTLFHFLRDDGHLHENLNGIVLYLGEHALADDFLDNQRNGDYQMWSHRLESLCNDGRGGQAVEEEQMVTRAEGKQELNSLSVHMGHG